MRKIKQGGSFVSWVFATIRVGLIWFSVRGFRFWWPLWTGHCCVCRVLFKAPGGCGILSLQRRILKGRIWGVAEFCLFLMYVSPVHRWLGGTPYCTPQLLQLVEEVLYKRVGTPWCCDAVMLWCHDAVMRRWCRDAVMLWCCDAVMPWCRDVSLCQAFLSPLLKSGLVPRPTTYRWKV